MKDIYQVIASFSLDFYVESRPDRDDIETVLDQDVYEVINKLASSIERKLKPNESLVEKLEDFYEKELSKAMVENMFMDIELQEMNIKGIEFFVAFCNYVAQSETQFIVESILYKRGCI